jgi:hypothetical protein
MKTTIVKNALALSLTATIAFAAACFVPKQYTCLPAIYACVVNPGAGTSTLMVANATYASECEGKTSSGAMGYYDCHNSSITCYQTVTATRWTGTDCGETHGVYLGTATTPNSTAGTSANLGEPGCY